MKRSRKDRPEPSRKPRSLLQQLALMPDKLFNGGFRLQYGALCYRWIAADDFQVLLITSRGTGRWVIPKGWPMKKKKPHEAAEIEAWEEAGIRGRVRKKPVGRYTYLKWLDNSDVAPCVVEVFEIEVKDVVSEYKERGQRQLAWVSSSEAARRVREVELKSLLIDFKPKSS
ncbi:MULTISPECIES: NUDIX hydrolase [Agrobacterium]|nr:NUDIX hydrolase [Agrobacterium larrymoorei]